MEHAIIIKGKTDSNLIFNFINPRLVESEEKKENFAMKKKGWLSKVKESFSKWKARRRDKNGKRALWNLGKLSKKKGMTK
ncbi:MAG: hypothetical protein AAB778_01065 [Patescibacteria group bacterium]